MSPRTKYQVGSAILAIAILMLVIEILGMSGVIPKYVPPRNVTLVAMVLVILAGGLRRRGRAEMAAGPPAPPA